MRLSVSHSCLMLTGIRIRRRKIVREKRTKRKKIMKCTAGSRVPNTLFVLPCLMFVSGPSINVYLCCMRPGITVEHKRSTIVSDSEQLIHIYYKFSSPQLTLLSPSSPAYSSRFNSLWSASVYLWPGRPMGISSSVRLFTSLKKIQ